MHFMHLVLKSLFTAAGMFWMMFWALMLGFMLSGAIMAFVPKQKIVKRLGKAGPKELALALILGAISSSCSYAAAAMAKTLFHKGANITSVLAFMLASTNLVLELSIVLWLMMGWQFVVAEFLGGLVLVSIMAMLMHFFGPLKDFAKIQNREIKKNNDEEPVEQPSNPRTLEGWEQAAKSFVMEWSMIWKDIVLGVGVSGVLMVFVPENFWNFLFLQNRSVSDHHFDMIKVVENGLMGPLVSMVTFVCSVGNIPLANVLYSGGISFGGTISFIFADLIIIPLILIYRKYYGWKLALWITGIFYVSMALSGILIDILFELLGWVPQARPMFMSSAESFFKINYTFYLNMMFLLLAMGMIVLAKRNKKEAQCH